MSKTKKPNIVYGKIVTAATGPRYNVRLDSGVMLYALKDVNDRMYGEDQRVLVRLISGGGEINGIASKGVPEKTTVVVSI